MTDNIETVHGYVTDMIAVEKHIVEALDRQLESEPLQKHSSALRIVRSSKQLLDNHIDSLERHLAQNGDSNSTLKDAIATALGAVAGLIDKGRSDTASKMLRDDYTALSLAAISYTMLHTTALALGDQVVATMALKHLKDITPIVTEISKVISEVVAREITDEGTIVNANAGIEGTQNTQTAWEPQHVNRAIGM